MTSLLQHIHLPLYSRERAFIALVGFSATGGAWLIYRFLIKPLLSPLRDLPGPKSHSFLWGTSLEIFKAGPGELHEKWVDTYGPTLTYKLVLNNDRLMTLDTKAISHVLNHSYTWVKPPALSTNLAMLLGEGILFAEGDNHKRQRRVMNPSFTLSHLRDLTPIFLEKAAQLRDIWNEQSMQNGGSYNTDVQAWLNRATLDIIGQAGFNYEFNALDPNDQGTELSNAFKTVYVQSQSITLLTVLQTFIPPLRLIPTGRSRAIANARKKMDAIGIQLVNEKRRAILASAEVYDEKGQEVKIEKRSVTSRDLLSRLMVANMATDLRENQRLSDTEVFSQIPTFLIAGHETTAAAVTWALYALSRDPEIQSKLRGELLGLKSPMPSMDEIDALPYLDAVVRETLRIHPVVSMTTRMTKEDDVIPLGTPFKDKHGNLRHEIRVKRGESIIIPIVLMNSHKEIWGNDAKEFRPERWEKLPEKVNDIPGHLNLLSFIGGSRSCIGYRFAIIEAKCLLWTLISAFTFDFVDPAHRDDIIKKSAIVTRPLLQSEAEKGSQLPLKVTPWRAA